MGIAGTTAVLVGLLGVAILVAIGAERLRVPGAVALVAFGAGTAAIHPIALPFAFGETLLFVFLPPLIFEAAWNIDPAVLRRTAVRITVLAIPGVIFTAGSIGFALAFTGQLPLAAAIVFGSIVSATDPVAVLAIFRRLSVPHALQMIVEGESIANDGVAIVIYGIAVAFAAGTETGSFGHEIVKVILEIAGGIVVGALWAVVVAFVMGRTDSGAIKIAATVVLAFLSYVSADAAGLSGVFASAAAGIALRGLLRIPAGPTIADDVDAFWGTLAFIANAFVFLLTGLTMRIDDIIKEPLLVVTAIALVVVSRVLLGFIAIPSFSWRVTFVMAGMRGALSLALALALPADLPFRSQIIAAVDGVVLFTIVVQGIGLEPLLKRLNFQSGIGGPSPSS